MAHDSILRFTCSFLHQDPQLTYDLQSLSEQNTVSSDMLLRHQRAEESFEVKGFRKCMYPVRT